MRAILARTRADARPDPSALRRVTEGPKIKNKVLLLRAAGLTKALCLASR